MSIKNIKTVILVMFENRSFDNMLGHLKYEGIMPDARGLESDLQHNGYENLYNGHEYAPFPCPQDQELSNDLPHEYNYVATQLAIDDGPPPVAQMTGFVEAYASENNGIPGPQPDPLSFYSSKQVPMTSFLARTFSPCDNWFCPVPTSTQPNRTVAFCGHTEIYETKTQIIPATNNLFDWMNKHHITWTLYHDALSFFLFYPDIWRTLDEGNVVRYDRFATDLKNGNHTQVMIVEPSYQDAPHLLFEHPNDNHPPVAVGWGEMFLRQIYLAVTANPDVWKETLMIVYYDEHGGFYDHVAPPLFDNAAAGNAIPPLPTKFTTLGPRIPAILVSPWIEPGKVQHDLYDHTSVLQLLTEIFTEMNEPYSAQVDYRAKNGIQSLSKAIVDTPTNLTPPAPPADPIFPQHNIGDPVALPPKGKMAEAFENTARDVLQSNPGLVDKHFPELNNWKQTVDLLRPGAAISGAPSMDT